MHKGADLDAFGKERLIQWALYARLNDDHGPDTFQNEICTWIPELNVWLSKDGNTCIEGTLPVCTCLTFFNQKVATRAYEERFLYARV